MSQGYGRAPMGAAHHQMSCEHLVPAHNPSRDNVNQPHTDEPTPMLEADESSYSMQAISSSGGGGAGGTRRYDNPDAGWVEKHSAGYHPPTGGGAGESGKKKWIWVGALVAVLVVAGIVAGVVVHKMMDKSDDSSSSSGSSGSTSGDPSKFDKDGSLHQSFYGLCYTPFDSQYQFGCGATLSSVIEDIQIASQLTTRLRLYGADCNVTALTLQAIQDTKTNLTIFPAIYLNSEDPGDTAWQRQLNNITWAFDNYGLDHVGGIAIGNEYLLNGGNVTALLAYVTKFRDFAKQKGWDISVGTGDAGSMFTSKVAQGVDFMMANVHAYFAGTLVEDGPGWTWKYFEETDDSLAKAASNQPKAYIAETGWPSGANSTSELTYKNDDGTVTGAVAGLKQLQTFLDGYVCEANTNGTGYFFFELFDEEWKNDVYGGVEGYWGLFDKNKKLKSITLPDCSHT
ncbi:hypothetical protein ACQY0O_001915 [Thecaphora frezii]